MLREKLIKTALGEYKADLVLKNGRVINVFSGEIITADIAIVDGFIAGVGDYSCDNEVNLEGKYVSPGFINTHCHVESSMVTPPVYCMEELRWGVTTLITDPHEIANVLGGDGVKFMLEASADCPINYYVQIPSCVPATPFEHCGGVFGVDKMAEFLSEPRVIGLGEMMNYIGVTNCDKDIMDKLELFDKRIIDGHAPGVSGKNLQAYVSAGIHTDHESTSYEEAIEKLRLGIAILVREGSACKNVTEIMTGIIKNKINTSNMAFCTDDKHLSDIHRDGTVRYNIKTAIELGLDPVSAIQMGTINGAKIYGLHDVGAIAPSYKADIVVLSDLEKMEIDSVYKDGKKIVDFTSNKFEINDKVKNTINLPILDTGSFDLPQKSEYPVINLISGQITTTKSYIKASDVQSLIAKGELCKIAVVERHHGTGNIGIGLISGYGLQGGAVAATVAHDSHNLIVVGDNSEDMLIAAKELARVHGGYTVINNGEVLDSLPLPVCGLMSEDNAQNVMEHLDKMIKTAYNMGVNKNIDPFITLSFMALPVIPEIRITDMGIFDVINSKFI